jgi:hypothetical protein
MSVEAEHPRMPSIRIAKTSDAAALLALWREAGAERVTLTI